MKRGETRWVFKSTVARYTYAIGQFALGAAFCSLSDGATWRDAIALAAVFVVVLTSAPVRDRSEALSPGRDRPGETIVVDGRRVDKAALVAWGEALRALDHCPACATCAHYGVCMADRFVQAQRRRSGESH